MASPNDPTILQTEFLKALRLVETYILKFHPSWDQFLFREPVVPAKRLEWNTVDEDIPVEVSENGVPGRRALLTRSRTGANLHFFVAEMEESWVENWFREQHNGALPVPIQGTLQNDLARIVAEVHRKLDTYFWSGNTKYAVTGILGQDSTPTASASLLAAATGPKDFVKAVIASVGRAAGDFIRGQVVMSLDAKLYPQLIRPYDDAGGAAGPTALSMVSQLIQVIIPVDNPVHAGQAVIHYKAPDNAAALIATPTGIQAYFGEAAGNRLTRMFHLAGFAQFRPGKGFYGITSLS